MAALKSKSLKSSLEVKARKNARVTKVTNKNSQVLKECEAVEHEGNPHNPDTPVVGVSVGITKNMGNYESLKVDVWLTDKKQDDESINEAYERVSSVVSDVLQDIVNEYV